MASEEADARGRQQEHASSRRPRETKVTARCLSRRLFTVLVLAAQLHSCSTWFHSGELSWQRVNMTVHFELRTAWELSGYPSTLTRMTVGEDFAAFNAAWQSSIAAGPGRVLNVSEGVSRDARRSIVLCEPRNSPGCTLQTNSSNFNFIITRLDPELVHASLKFSHTYEHPGVFKAYFEGCCRSQRLHNNGGLSFHLRASVDVMQTGVAPRLALPAILQLQRAGKYLIEAIDEPRTSRAVYRLGDADEMGFAMDRPLGLPWGVPAPGPFLEPNGVTISSEGVLSLASESTAGCANGCLLQVTLIAFDGNASTVVDLVIEVVSRQGPQAEEVGLLATPHTSLSAPSVILCNSSDFMPPENSTYKVSECIELAEMQKFHCESYLGICPSRDYAFTHPYNSPLYSNCFSADACIGGLHRVFCSEVTQQGHSADFLRLVFKPAPGTTIRYIRQVNEFPAGVEVLGSCGQHMADGTCEGIQMWAGADAPNKFLDVKWRPQCTDPSHVRLWGLCFVAEGSDGVRSLPSCLYIRVTGPGSLSAVPLVGFEQVIKPDFYPFTYVPPSAPQPVAEGTVMQMVMYRQPSHIIAEESFIVQPQVAFLDIMGRLLTGLTIYTPTVEISVSPIGLHPEVELSGNRMTHIEQGIAVFTDLVLAREGAGYMLRIRAAAHSSQFQIDTPRFFVLPAALKVKIATQPANSLAGMPLSGPPRVILMDLDNNYAALSTKLMGVELLTVSTTTPGLTPALHGQTTVPGVQGSGKFENLKVMIAGEYRLTFSVGEFTTQSSLFSVRAGQAAIIFIDQQPCSVPCLRPDSKHQVAGDLFETSISLRDSYYNQIFSEAGVSYPNASVSLRRYPTKPNVAAILVGTLSIKTSPQPKGALGYTFTDLSIMEQGFFSIVFNVHFEYITPYISNTTLVFDVQLPVHSLKVSVPPATSTAGSHVQGPPTFDLLDAYNFKTMSQRASWTVLNSSAAVFSCAATCTDAMTCYNKMVPYNDTCRQPDVIVSGAAVIPFEGLATFSDIVLTRAAVNYRLTIYSSPVISIATPYFTVEHSEPYELVVTRLPLKMIISEPFGVQPLAALVDEFGNVCLKESTRFVEAELISITSGSFLLSGVPKIRLRRGLADFHNLAVESASLVSNLTYHRLRFKCVASRAGIWTTFNTTTAGFDVDAGVLALSVNVQPLNSVAGQALRGVPSVHLLASDGNTLGLANRTLSARIVEEDCPAWYPVPDPVVPRVIHAEMRGSVPIVSGQAFVVTSFRAVGFGPNARAIVKVVDAAFDCDSNQSEVGGLVGANTQSLLCDDDGKCVSEAKNHELYLSFTVTTVPASGSLRVCAKAEGHNYAVVAVALQQLGTWKLWTTMPVVKYVAPLRIPAHRPQPIDQVTLWWAGSDFDSCKAFRMSSSDSRVAFVLSRDLIWNASHQYTCPRHPETGQIYRWATSEEVLALGTLFTGKGEANLVYGSECGAHAQTVVSSKRAFLFSDFLRAGVYAKSDNRENQSLASGTPSETNVAGLVCVSDEVFLQCTGMCHKQIFNDECPVPDVQPGSVEEDMPMMFRWTLHAQNKTDFLSNRRLLQAGPDVVVSPEITSYMRSEITGNSISLASGTISLGLTLQREPASWVIMVPNQSPRPELVTWDAGATLLQNTWSDGVRFVFGGNGQGWDYSRHELHSTLKWDEYAYHNITCGSKCSQWPINTTVELVYTLYSSVPSYNGTKLVITIRKAPETAEMAAELMGPSVIHTPPPLQTPAPPPPVVQQTPPPGPNLDFCIRTGAHWRIGGDPPGTEMCTHDHTGYKCGITWCGKKVKQIDAGGYHSCSIDQDDKILCWGRNSSEQAQPPWNVRSSTVKSVDTGTHHTCAVLGDDSVSCWGDNLRGQTSVPAAVTSWRSVSCGTAHSCGIDAAGAGHCWGDGTYGQSSVPADATNLASISAGFFHTCAVAVNGRGHCWGSFLYDFGQTILPVLEPWKQISAGNLHTCGVLLNGTALCWGLDDTGQTRVPPVAAGISWVGVSAGLRHSCGHTSDGHMYCWGSSALNRLFVKPMATGPWISVSVGYEHSCGLMASGRIACWGAATYGQLAVSAAHFVFYSPPCTASPSDLSGHHACNANQGIIQSFVDISMSVLTTLTTIHYTVSNTTANAEVTSPLQYSQPLRFDVSAVVTAEARSLDDEVTNSDMISYNYVVQVGVPALTVAAPSVMGAAYYLTSVEILLASDASMNPYSSTSIFFTTDNSNPLAQTAIPYTPAKWSTQLGSNVSEYMNALVLGNSTSDVFGNTLLKVVAKRHGAVDSQQASMNFLTKVSPIVFSHGNVTAFVVNARGIDVLISTSTPDVHIFYTICRPSICQMPVDPSMNTTRYTGAFTVNETGTIVRTIGYKANLATSDVSEMTYNLQLPLPVLTPPPHSDVGFLAPVFLNITCELGGYPMYSLNGSEPTLLYTETLYLERNLTLRAICVRRMRSGMMLDSKEVRGHYHISLLEILDSPVTEQSNITKADNRITVAVRTTLAITQGTTITITGLVGSATEDHPNLPLSYPGLHGAWTKSTGTLKVVISSPPTSEEPIFGVTDSQHCAETLPLTELDFASCDPLSTCDAQLSSRYYDVVHGGWEQDFYVNSDHKMTILYEFQEKCTLRDRLTGSRNAGNADCDIVRWKVTYHGTETTSPTSLLYGFYRFSQFSRSSSMFASIDDGAWGAAEGVNIMSNGPRPQSFWGQGVFDSADPEPGQCDSLYIGNSDSPVVSNTLRSVLRLTRIDSSFVFSFVLVNPSQSQAPVTPTIVVEGGYCDSLGCATQILGPKAMVGSVLGASMSFGIMDAEVRQTSSAPGAGNVVSLALKTNLKVSAEVCLPYCNISVSHLSGSPQSLPVQVGRSNVPETKSVSFECNGYRSCQTIVRNYLPPGAVFVSASLDVFIACSDFNAADEVVEILMVGGSNVANFNRGPWAGCEASCSVEKQVLQGHSVATFTAGEIPVHLAASQSVDAYSCSQTSTSFVRARVVVNVEYYYSGMYLPGLTDDSGVLNYQLRPTNLDPGCVDGAYSLQGAGSTSVDWKDSVGYGCRDYAAFDWCNEEGQCGGDGWTCADFAVNSTSAKHVCCACGGGQRWWMRVSFALTNSAVSGAAEPRVAILRADGFVLLNETLEGHLLGSLDASAAASSRSASPQMVLLTTSAMRRRLLQVTGGHCSVSSTIQVMWPVADMELYTCCWAELQRQVAKAVAETVLTATTNVHVTLTSRNETYANASISVIGDSNDSCIGIANNLRPNLVARALSTQRLHVDARFVSGGTPVAHSSSGDVLSVMTVNEVGYDGIGEWYEANFAGFPNKTEVAYVQQFETGRVLTSNHSELSLAGMVEFGRIIVNKACSGYRLKLFTLISDTILDVTSNAFVVRAGTAARFYVSPVSTMVAENARWPCWAPQSCPATSVVAGMYFAVTATVVDSLNNTCLDADGAVNVSIVMMTGETNAVVYGDDGEMLLNGSRVLKLRITEAFQDAANPAKLVYTYIPQKLVAESQIFAVYAAPLAVMWMETSALDDDLYAGNLIAPELQLFMRDAYGNVVLEFLEVEADLLNEPNVLLGKRKMTSREGFVSFGFLSIEKAATNYSIVFFCDGVVNITQTFEVMHATTVSSLVVDRSPADAVAGEALTVQPRLRLLDAFGNTATRSANPVTVTATGLAGTTTAQMFKGAASFTDLVIMMPGAAMLTFQLSDGSVAVSAPIDVGPSLAKLKMVQQPVSTMVRTCARPYPSIELLSADYQAVNNSRKEVKADIAVNVFRMTNEMSCGTGGCFASTSFRYYLPQDAELINAWLDVDVAKTDFDEDEEFVEYILINGVPWGGDAASPDGRCNPNVADMCFSYHKCVGRFDVSNLASENYLTVTAKISAAVNDFCAPRLQARVQLYGNYRPQFPETVTMLQNSPSVPLGGLTTLKASGRTLVFKDLFFPVPGYGYRLRVYTDAGMVSTETEPFDVWDTASKAEFIRQPAEAMAGEPLRKQPVIKYEDQYNNLVTSYEPMVQVSIGTAQQWDQTLNGGSGGWQDLTGAQAPVLLGVLRAKAEGGVVQFVDIIVDRPVERLTLLTRACLIGPTGLVEGVCVEKESIAFMVAKAVQSLGIQPGSLPLIAKAGRKIDAKILLYDGALAVAPSTSTVDVSAVNTATGNNTVEGQLTVAASAGVAQFSDFYFTEVGTYNVTFKVERGGVVLAIVEQHITVEAGDAASIAVVHAAVDFAVLWAGEPFLVQVEILDKFGNRNLSPDLTPIVRTAQGSNYQLFVNDTSDSPNMIHNKTVDGVAEFYLRVDSATVVTVYFAVALSPAEDCSVQNVSEASPAGCATDSRGLQYCEQADFLVDSSACLDLPLCSYITASQRCSYACQCAGGNRESYCSACVATTSLDLRFYASVSTGQAKLSMLLNPGSAVDGLQMQTQPKILVQVCTPISQQCNPIANVMVHASLQSAEDEFTRVGQPARTKLLCSSGNSVGGNCSAISDYNGIATFTDLGVDAPGSDGATNLILNFTAHSAEVSAAPFDLIAQQNEAPVFVDPTPLLCEDDDTPLVYYATVGSRLHIVLAASDINTAPYDELTMQVTCSVKPSSSHDCQQVMPKSAYISENIYESATLLAKPYIPECDLRRPLVAGEPKKRNVRQKNSVQRHFVWSPVSWFPTLSLRYKAVEAERRGLQQDSQQLSTCERTVQVVVCDRPKFVAPSPIGAQGHLMVLAHTDIVFTVAAQDRNQDDVLELVVTDPPDDNDMEPQVGPNVYDKRLLVTGLETTSRNRVSRSVRWSVPNDGITHTVCFRARDNQFPCGDDGGLISEDTLCVHCTLEPRGVYTTCSSTLKAEKLDVRMAPIVCGDGRMTDVEQCDDANLESGDGCSSLCTLEAGYDQLDADPQPENVCGDGLVVMGETCDDNNTIAADGCSGTCQTEGGFSCFECGGYTECLPTCGDGIMTGNHLRVETCDNVDGCSSECSIEDGWNTSLVPNVLTPICGDGLIRGDEECDDNNVMNGDGCSEKCKVEDNWDCGAAGCSAICGDGVRAGVEQCDDGNLLAGDGCDPTCRTETFFFCANGTYADICAEICADGERAASNSSRVRPGFDRINACDDGNSVPLDGCSPTCEIEVDLGWECFDDMSAAGTLQSPRSACRPSCGDGMRTDTEECDDGNQLNKDGCSSICTVETGFVCHIGTAGTEAQMLMQPSSCLQTLQANGTCCFENRNASFANNCSQTAQAGDPTAYCLRKSDLCLSSQCEPTVGKSEEICYMAYMGTVTFELVMANMRNVSYLHRGTPDMCTSSCGDGHRALQEECDDANMQSGDGCGSDCKIEGGWYCLHQPGPAGDFCSTICGDAVLVPGVEECDDGAWTEPWGDGCSSTCKLEAGFNCSYNALNRLSGARCKPICGDGRWVLGEACDDGNVLDDDGCSIECKVEDGWVCGADSSKPDMNTSVCIGLCGDGIKVSGEECDDDNIRDQDGCTQSCKIEPGFACLPSGDCFTVCGDGVVIGKESCDDGNQVNGDGCREDCRIEHGYQCISANCTASGCRLQEGGLGSYCQECPPVRQTAVRCSHPPCPVVGLTADCENWFFGGDGAWMRKNELPVSSFSMACRPEWYADGFCDALNNREECGYDLGDCCQRSCACGGATSRACYNGVMGGCGRFKDKAGDYRCLQTVDPETGMNLATDVGIVHLTGGTNLGTDMFGPYLSWVQVELSTTRPEIAMYFSTDGQLPAEETATQLLTSGKPYTSAFNVTVTTIVRVSTVMWGLGVGQLELPIKIQAEKPIITPASSAAKIMTSPVLVSIDTATPDAVIKYSFSGLMGSSPEQFVYTGPFAINSVSTVTAWTEKEGVLPSESVSVSYSLKTTTPVIVPPPGAYLGEVGVNVSSDTVMANVYVTVCNRTEYPGWSNKSTGQIFQTQQDFYCYPDCRGVCVGGYNDNKPCGGTSDLLTCGGKGSCVEEFREVRLCYPHEWPPGRIIWSQPIILNETRYGTGAWVTSYATHEGLADSNFTTQQYQIITETPTLHLMPHVHVAVPWPNANSPSIAIPFLEHGRDEGPYPGPLSFNFSNSRPATVYYTLNGVYPTPGAPGTIEVPYSNIQSTLKLNQSANVSWIGLAKNLAPSPLQWRTIAIQAVAPELMVDVRFLDKAGGMVDLKYYDAFKILTTDTKRGLVSEGFAYPGIGKVVLSDQNFFADRTGGWPPPPGWPLLSMRTYTREARIFYRLLNGTNTSTELPTWPATSVRPGTTLANTTQGLLAEGWREYTGLRMFDFNSPSAGIEIRRNYTVELMTAVPGSALIPSNIVSYPLFVRERCEQGRASIDGYGPCALCPLDSYMVCHGVYNSPPCVCLRCDKLANDTGTSQRGSPDVGHCKPFCRPGSYSPQEGIDMLLNNCTQCPLGTYSDKKRASECTECPVGTATWRHGASSISDCRGAGGLIAGGFHTCGVDVIGAAKCWGYNGFNQTVVPKKLVRWEEHGVPYAEYHDDTWYSVAAGSFHSCGITLNFEAKCWGQEFAGKTKVPTMHLYDSPQMPLQEIVEWTVISASAGYHHSCGIADNRAICWGDDEYRQTQVPTGHHWRSISAGQFHTCAVDDKAKAHCWGDDSYGQSHVPDVPDQVPWRNVSAGHYHSCGVTGFGDMHCWGSTLYEATAFPQEVESWSAVAVGRYHSCGLTADGDVRCWGSNQDGAISVPEVGNSKWRAVTAGLFHTCGILEDRTGLCWGRSVYGLTLLPEAAWSSV